jgi:hypothetical protein
MESDPLNYIFGILRYISNTINVNNHNNNNINDRIIKAFGPCVRSILRKESYSDIFLIISCRWTISEFLGLLKIFELIPKYVESDISKLIIFDISYQGKQYKIHMGTDIYKFTYFMNNKFGITCDNLAIDFEGTVSPIISHHLVKGHTNISWITSCIQDVMDKKFRAIILEDIFSADRSNYIGNFEIGMSPFDKLILQNEIIENMGYLGYIFDAENTKNLTSYKFYGLISHVDIKDYDKEREISISCCICREDYLENMEKKTILIGCHHDFHIDCLKKWVNQNKRSCPICRTSLHFL